jgi:integral membrane protein
MMGNGSSGKLEIINDAVCPILFLIFVQICGLFTLQTTLFQSIYMTKYCTTSIGRLRLSGFLEGVSFLVLLFIAMPMKYMFNEPTLVRIIGAIHGGLFLLFVLITLQVAVEKKWKFTDITWKVLLASVIPFATFYIDSKILRKL